jgi:hypothetical protein
MIQGKFRADGLAIMEVLLSSYPTAPPISVKSVFVNTRDGSSLGTSETKNLRWSKKTLAALDAFREALEEDLAGHYFAEVADVEEEPVLKKNKSGGGGGLSEHLTGGDNDDAESV